MHQYLLRATWGPGYINQSQYLRVLIARLRKKIENDQNRPGYLLTKSGVVYRIKLLLKKIRPPVKTRGLSIINLNTGKRRSKITSLKNQFQIDTLHFSSISNRKKEKSV
jgi:hypothetical protein